MPKMKAIPLNQATVNTYIATYHRHHGTIRCDKYRIGCEVDGFLVGVIQVARPVSRHLDNGLTLEVARLCTNGDMPNVCSFLYARAAKIAKLMGYEKIITYILDSETGASLRAVGWTKEVDIKGHSWSCPSRPRNTVAPICDKQRWAKTF